MMVFVEHLDHDHGHWCNTCRLATGLRHIVISRTTDTMTMVTGTGCVECGGSDITITPDDAYHCR